MQTSRFQLGLIATLAVGLGFSLASSEAVGYPAGAAVSLGTNPVWSVGGTIGGEIVTVLTAPSDQAGVVTDVAITATGHRDAPCTTTVTLLDDDATISAAYQLASNTRPSNYAWAPTSVVQSLSSGIAVAPGDTLRISVDSTCSPSTIVVAYTLSGYYAQP
jgi:hypothetical protein